MDLAINKWDFASALFIGFILLFLVLYTYFYNIEKKRIEKIRLMTFKVAQISDNLDNSFYKIVGETLSGEYRELEQIQRTIRLKDFYIIPKHRLEDACKSFLNKEEAEQELKKFLIHVGQVEYKKQIKLVD